MGLQTSTKIKKARSFVSTKGLSRIRDKDAKTHVTIHLAYLTLPEQGFSLHEGESKDHSYHRVDVGYLRAKFGEPSMAVHFGYMPRNRSSIELVKDWKKKAWKKKAVNNFIQSSRSGKTNMSCDGEERTVLRVHEGLNLCCRHVPDYCLHCNGCCGER